MSAPACFCDQPAHQSFSRRLGVVYDCCSVHTGPGDALAAASPRICAFHVHAAAWRIFAQDPTGNAYFMDDRLAACEFFNFTFCAVFRQSNRLPMAHPSPPRCSCSPRIGLAPYARLQRHDGLEAKRSDPDFRRYYFACEFDVLLGPGRGCGWRQWVEEVRFSPHALGVLHPNARIDETPLRSVTGKHRRMMRSTKADELSAENELERQESAFQTTRTAILPPASLDASIKSSNAKAHQRKAAAVARKRRGANPNISSPISDDRFIEPRVDCEIGIIESDDMLRKGLIPVIQNLPAWIGIEMPRLAIGDKEQVANSSRSLSISPKVHVSIAAVKDDIPRGYDREPSPDAVVVSDDFCAAIALAEAPAENSEPQAAPRLFEADKVEPTDAPPDPVETHPSQSRVIPSSYTYEDVAISLSDTSAVLLLTDELRWYRQELQYTRAWCSYTTDRYAEAQALLDREQRTNNELRAKVDERHTYAGKCRVCLETEVTIIALPCGHAVLCKRCWVYQPDRCVVCRAPVVEHTKIFLG